MSVRGDYRERKGVTQINLLTSSCTVNRILQQLTLALDSRRQPLLRFIYVDRSTAGTGLSITTINSWPRSYQSNNDTGADVPTESSFAALSFSIMATSVGSIFPFRH